MITIFIIDLFLNSFFQIPSNLIISYIPFIKNNNIISYFFIYLYLCINFYAFNIYNYIIVILIIIINKRLLIKRSTLMIILIDYFIYYLAFGLKYNSMNIINFLNTYLFTSILVLIIYHILPKFNIKLNR